MTLREIVEYIEDLAKCVPDIRTYIRNDVLRLNEAREAKYGIFAITQNQHTYRSGWLDYSLNLFYIDRLTNSRDNELEIQSHGLEVLRAIIQRASEDLTISEARFNTFTDRFQDLCAGVWVTATFTAPLGDCLDINFDFE